MKLAWASAAEAVSGSVAPLSHPPSLISYRSCCKWYVPLTFNRPNNFATSGTWHFMRHDKKLDSLSDPILTFVYSFRDASETPWTL
jgi:hypothetical protein